MDDICDDLIAEHGDLLTVLDTLRISDWEAETPAAGWAVRDQISHLWFFDQRAALALTDPEAFEADKRTLFAAAPGTDPSVTVGREISAAELQSRWIEDAARLATIARSADPSSRVPWYGPSMAPKSFITARLMETWAHGQDIVDTVGGHRAPTDRLRHVAHIGVRARPFSYLIRGREVPVGEIHVALTAPSSGEVWTWNSPDSPDRVTGSALDFSLLVTQRRHISELDLVVTGELAADWLSIAQAFAGGPTDGRQPR
jgi:uncharacterized protein (TIGR03084 family)